MTTQALDIARPVRGRLLGQVRDRIAASDPAFSRLRMASRALLSLFLNGTVLAGITWLHTLPVACYGLAAVISFTGSMAVRDKPGKPQLLTRLFAALGSILAVLLASILAPIPIVADLAFLLVIFVAVYIRKFGQRWFAVGMIAFMSYFMGDYLRPLPTDMGWIALSAAIAFAMTHIVTNFILPADQEDDFRRAMTTIDRRINVLLRHLRALAIGDAKPGDFQPLRMNMGRLRDIVLMAEGFLPQGEQGSLAADGPASNLALALFELQLSVERLVRISLVALPPVDLLNAVLHHDDLRMQRAAARLNTGTGIQELPAHALLRVYRAHERLDDALGPEPSPAFISTESLPPSPNPATTEPASSGSAWVPAALRLPIQVTLACAIALGCGLLLSTTRWYWAVITAFLVFNNTRSRDDTMSLALLRSGGTFAGLIVGTGAAALLQGDTIVSAILVLVFFFLGFYFLQISYGLLTFFITIALGLLYNAMGTYTPDVLVVRLEETVIGAAAGILVAFFVFPVRATAGVTAALDAYLLALGSLIEAVQGRLHGKEGAGNLLAMSRALDRSYADMLTKVRPLGGPWAAVSRFGPIRQTLLLLSGCVHWGHALAQSLYDERKLDAAEVERLDNLAREALDRVLAARKAAASFFERRQRADDIPPSPPRPLSAIAEDETALSLEVISSLLERATPTRQT